MSRKESIRDQISFSPFFSPVSNVLQSARSLGLCVAVSRCERETARHASTLSQKGRKGGAGVKSEKGDGASRLPPDMQKHYASEHIGTYTKSSTRNIASHERNNSAVPLLF